MHRGRIGVTFFLGSILGALFLFGSGFVSAQTAPQTNASDDANDQCPKVDASHGYRSDLAFNAVYKEGTQQKLNLYHKVCTDKLKSTGTLTALGECRGPDFCEIDRYRDVDGTIRKVSDINKEISNIAQPNISVPTAEEINKQLQGSASRDPTPLHGSITDWSGQNAPVQDLSGTKPKTDAYNFSTYLNNLSGGETPASKDTFTDGASPFFDPSNLSGAPQAKLQDLSGTSGEFDKNDPTLFNSYGYKASDTGAPSDGSVTGFSAQNGAEQSATGFESSSKGCEEGWWCKVKTAASNTWDYIKSGDYLGIGSAEAKPSIPKWDSEAEARELGQQKFDVTAYYPCTSASACPVQGGPLSSVPGPDGKSLVRTLDDYRLGRSDYVTGASDPRRYGETYVVPEITYKSALDGQTYTLEGVPVAVHDTGSAFEGRPDKLDIATGVAQSDRQAAEFAREQKFLGEKYQTYTQYSAIPSPGAVEPIPASPSIQNMGSDASSPLGGATDNRFDLSTDIVPRAVDARIAESAFGPTVDSVRDINFAGLSGIHAVEVGAPLADITPLENRIPTPEWDASQYTVAAGERITDQIRGNSANEIGEAQQLADRLAQADTEMNTYADRTLANFPLPQTPLSGEEIAAQVNREIDAQYPKVSENPFEPRIPSRAEAQLELLTKEGASTVIDYGQFYDSTNAAPKQLTDAENARVDKALSEIPLPEVPSASEINAQLAAQGNANTSGASPAQTGGAKYYDAFGTEYNSAKAAQTSEYLIFKNEELGTKLQQQKEALDTTVKEYRDSLSWYNPLKYTGDVPGALPIEKDIKSIETELKQNAVIATTIEKGSYSDAVVDTLSKPAASTEDAVRRGALFGKMSEYNTAVKSLEDFNRNPEMYIPGGQPSEIEGMRKSLEENKTRLDKLVGEYSGGVQMSDASAKYIRESLEAQKPATQLAAEILDNPLPAVKALGAKFSGFLGDASKGFAPEGTYSAVDVALSPAGLLKGIAVDPVLNVALLPTPEQQLAAQSRSELGNAVHYVADATIVAAPFVSPALRIAGAWGDAAVNGERVLETAAGVGEATAAGSRLDRFYAAQSSASDALERSIARGAPASEIAGNRVQLENINAAIERVQASQAGSSPTGSVGAVVADEVIAVETNAALDSLSAGRTGTGQSNPSNNALTSSGNPARAVDSTVAPRTDTLFANRVANAQSELNAVPEAARGTGTNGAVTAQSSAESSLLRSSASQDVEFVNGRLRITIAPNRTLPEAGNGGIPTAVSDAAAPRASVPTIAQVPESAPVSVSTGRVAANDNIPAIVRDVAEAPRTSVPTISQTQEFLPAPSLYERVSAPVRDWFENTFVASERNLVPDAITEPYPNANVQVMQPPTYPAFTPTQTNGVVGARFAETPPAPTITSPTGGFTNNVPPTIFGAADGGFTSSVVVSDSVNAQAALDRLANQQVTLVPSAPVAANAPTIGVQAPAVIQDKGPLSSLWDNTLGRVFGKSDIASISDKVEAPAITNTGVDAAALPQGRDISVIPQLATEPTIVPRIEIAESARPTIRVSTDVPPANAVDVVISDSYDRALVQTPTGASKSAWDRSVSAAGNQTHVYMSAEDAAALAKDPTASVTAYPIPRAPLAQEVKVGAQDSIQNIFQNEAQKPGFFGGLKEKFTNFIDNLGSTESIAPTRVEPTFGETPVASGAKVPEIPSQTRPDLVASDVVAARAPAIEPVVSPEVAPVAESRSWGSRIKEFFGIGKSEGTVSTAERFDYAGAPTGIEPTVRIAPTMPEDAVLVRIDNLSEARVITSSDDLVAFSKARTPDGGIQGYVSRADADALTAMREGAAGAPEKITLTPATADGTPLVTPKAAEATPSQPISIANGSASEASVPAAPVVDPNAPSTAGKIATGLATAAKDLFVDTKTIATSCRNYWRTCAVLGTGGAVLTWYITPSTPATSGAADAAKAKVVGAGAPATGASPANADKIPPGGLPKLTVEGVQKALAGTGGQTQQPPEQPQRVQEGLNGNILSAIGSFFSGLLSGIRGKASSGASAPTATPTSSGTSATAPTTAPIKPSVAFISNPSSVKSGDTAQLSWAAVGSTECTVTADDKDKTVITKGTYQSSFATKPLTQTTVFNIECKGGTTPVTGQVTVTVQ